MKTNPFAKSRASLALVTLLLLCFSIPSLRAEVFGLFTYKVVGGATVEITDYPDNAAGSVVIPAKIGGKPVTSIGDLAFNGCTGLASVTIPSSVTNIGGGPDPFSDNEPAAGAFSGCTGLTSVTLQQGLTIIGGLMFSGCTSLTNVVIPNSVTTIGYQAFRGCTGLTRIAVDPLNSEYVGLEGVLFNKSLTILVQYPGGKAGSYTIPNSVTTIDYYAFYGCTGLTSVTSIGWSAFEGCSGLTKAVFLGNAPGLAENVFHRTAPGFAIRYLSGSTGFTSPRWKGYPATMINEATWPAASWLLTHGLWYDTNLQQDPNGDGVSLLMAYALDLDPRLNLQSRLPGPVPGVNTLSLGFHAASPGITYTVETSTDLKTWTTQGVGQFAPGPDGRDGRATATVQRDAPTRFLRLVVTETE